MWLLRVAPESDLANTMGTGGNDAVAESDASTTFDASETDAFTTHDVSPTDARSQVEGSEGLEGGGSTDPACSRREWANANCPGLGCPEGTICVNQTSGNGSSGPLGCAPIPVSCAGVGTCACMSCVCDLYACSDTTLPGQLVCH